MPLFRNSVALRGDEYVQFFLFSCPLVLKGVLGQGIELSERVEVRSQTAAGFTR